MEREQAADQEKQDEINLWSNLDGDLLGEILSRLCLTDQARFRVVCKNWLAAYPIITKAPLPWHISVDSGIASKRQFKFRLYDPSSSNLAQVQSISLTELGIQSSSKMHIETTVHHNWLFICARESRMFFRDRKYFVLFSPFTRNFITLPKFKYPTSTEIILTFSTQPDSPDCVFFVLDTCNTKKIVLLTCRNGDREWTVKKFNTSINFSPCVCRLVYLCGMLYVVSPDGKLVSYDIVGGKFKFECYRGDELLALNFGSRRGKKVFELNGELMVLHLISQCIRKYDWSNKAWVPVSTLGDKALFVSDKSYDVVIIDKTDTRNDGVLSNKIYHFSAGRCRVAGRCNVYTVEEGELVEFKSTNSNLLEINGGNDLSEYMNNYCGIKRGVFNQDSEGFLWIFRVRGYSI